MELADDRPGGLLAWQFRNYSAAHTTRATLIVHALTAPLFMAACASFVQQLIVHPAYAPAAFAPILLTIVLQNRAHKREPSPPLPFRGAFDVAARLFVEQWITFPRFVLSGGFARAWRAAGGT